MRLCTLAALAGLLAPCISAASLVVSIPSSQLLPNPATLPASTHAILLGPPGLRRDSLLRSDNTFHFTDLPNASYLLTIHSRDYNFAPLRVDVITGVADESQATVSAWQTFRGNEWSNKGPDFGTAKDILTIQIQANSVKDYYQKRNGFSLLSFLKNPMILMGLVSVAMIVGIPYVMDNLDPEMKAELEEMQKGSSTSNPAQAAAEQIQNFDLAGWMAGKTATPAASSGSSSGASGSKKK